MKCFNHRNADAIAICKHCQKGICEDCSTIVGTSISCKGACEEEVAAYNYMMEKGMRAYRNMGKQWGPSSLINLAAGSLFAGFGLYTLNASPWGWFFVVLGAVMIVGGIMSVILGRRLADESGT